MSAKTLKLISAKTLKLISTKTLKLISTKTLKLISTKSKINDKIKQPFITNQGKFCEKGAVMCS